MTDTPAPGAATRPLSRAATGRPTAPVRLVHLGLGAFHRAHQAWYTDAANRSSAAGTAPANPAGIAAFTGHRPDAARTLAAQDGLYHLLVRDPAGDRAELVGSISACHPGLDLPAWRGALADPAVGCLTLTVTEAAYRIGSDGTPDAGAADLAADRETLRAAVRTGGTERAEVQTVPARLLVGLAARRRAGGSPLAVVPCDNLVANGPTVRRVVAELAADVDPALAGWIDAQVSFVSTMVDRITPATTDADRARVAELTGFADASPVVTEPFTEWVLAGDFPAGRPAWERAGATFVADVEPFERRKLWLLNGSHSLLAYAAPTRGHRTIAGAIADPECRSWVEDWWDAACRHLPLPAAELAAYRAALLERYENPRMRHLLAQIANDGSQKLPIRILPVLDAERAAHRLPAAAVTALAGFVLHHRAGRPVQDPRAAELAAAAAGPLREAVPRVLDAVRAGLSDDAELTAAVVAEAGRLAAQPAG